MKNIIYTSDPSRLALFKEYIIQQAYLPQKYIIYVYSIEYLIDTLKKYEYSIGNAILDFENDSAEQVSLFREKVKYLNGSINTLVLGAKVENKLFNINYTLDNFQKLLAFTPKFLLLNRDNSSHYEYKVEIKSNKIYLQEYFNDEKTKNYVEVKSFKDKKLRIEIYKGYSLGDAIHIVKRMFSEDSNVYNIFGNVDSISFSFNGVLRTFTARMSVDDMLETFRFSH